MDDVHEMIMLLDEKDKNKLTEFAQILIRKKKYKHLRNELEARRAEINRGEVFSHEELWSNLFEDV